MPRSVKSGPILRVLLSLVTFWSLLQLFDPFQQQQSLHKTNTNGKQSFSALEQGLAEFKAKKKKKATTTTTKIVADDRIAWLLQDAGVTTLTTDEQQQLPRWKQVVDLYGNDIIVHSNNKHCETFRQHVPHERILAVAGLFNTGTNLLNTQFTRNVRGVTTLWQVPWGKHRMADVKWNHTAHGMEAHNKRSVLPVVVIRDPLSWMQSMCAHPYAAHWRHGSHHCPNLVPSEQDRQHYSHLTESAFAVQVKYDESSQPEFASLAHLWSEYHQQYFHADYPVLFIRYEDLVFQPKQVLTAIAACVNATVNEPLRYQINTSKNHGSGTNWISAMHKTADAVQRHHNLTGDDIQYLQDHLDPVLMKLFHYSL